MAHTPGPWITVNNSQGYPYQITAPDQPRNRAGGISDITRRGSISFPSSDEGKANACLIAASPCLLDSLKAITEIYADLVDSGDCYGNRVKAQDLPEIVAARAAIAKATGEQP